MIKEVSHKPIGQRGFVDEEVGKVIDHQNTLTAIKQAIDWKPLEQALSSMYTSKEGRESYPPIVMLRILLLQQWYNLSDAHAEEAVRDRISFRYFCGFSLSDQTPDKTTLSTFRKKLRRLNIDLLEVLNGQLERKGLIVKKGTLVDATVIQADCNPPQAKMSEVDPEAGWTKKRGQYTYGYKAHVGVDEETEFVRKAHTTPANVHDSQAFYQCVSGDEQSTYADKAYSSKEHRQVLAKYRINARILFKAHRGQILSKTQRFLNKLYSKKRSAVERVFGTWKRVYGYRRSKYRGLERNQLHLTLLAVAHNMKRATVYAAS